MKAENLAGAVNAAGRLERLPLTRYQRCIFLIIATAWLFDSMDLAAMTFVLGSIKTEFGLSTAAAGFVASSSFFGMFVGAALAGVLSDRFGRKPVFQFSMVIWGVGSLLCGLCANASQLVGARVLLGVGMGMELPIALTLVSEFLPTRVRGKYSAILEGFLPVGFVAAGILVYFLMPVTGWRGVFIALAAPSLLLLVIRRAVPESPRWLETVGRDADAECTVSAIEEKVRHRSGMVTLPPIAKIPDALEVGRHSTLEILAELWRAPYARRTLMLWVVWFFTLLGYYGLTSWLGALLQAAGYQATKSVFYTIIISTAGIPGFFFAAWLLEAWGRKKASILMLLGSALTAYIYGQCAALKLPIGAVVAAGLAMQFFFFGMWCVIYAYTPELYPTRARATGAGMASSIGRLGSIIGPYAIGVALPVIGQGGVFAMGAVCFLISAVTIAVLGQETRGISLEEVSR